MCSRAAATHLVIGEGKKHFGEAPLCVSTSGTFTPDCFEPCTSCLAFSLICGVPELENRGGGVAVRVQEASAVTGGKK